jgi:hypothetical protein
MIKNFEKNSGRKFSKIGKTPLLRICFGGQKNSGGKILELYRVWPHEK